MTADPRLSRAVELLERSLGHTRTALAAVRPAHLHRPTPCARWDLDDLLWHMDDALDAFTEASAGLVATTPVRTPGSVAEPGVEARLGRLQRKACHLLGLWAALPRTTPVLVGDLPMDAPLLVGTAALEITVHGWDVGQATGEGGAVPADLAAALLPVAALTVRPTDRGRRFAAPLLLPGGVPADLRLLALLGRTPRSLTDAA
ncbi:TIGR03086 family metal-binding protein [Nocardioides sp. CFH 31398]|uniref:TIGR03086 family metal-binding protein n=1 Tax=Nocardioides sp. CFH 31398 TaxID=2919579 RepID=UPI001F05964E|nr:TIGR03086 family metal-binding protein [Nocardioides sp. CFH 31398]MCH1867918.1 TIGR03086 family metal-binding protein [Nocardioides sp. CFH 31398]